MTTGDRLTLQIDRPAAGGRMIARHEGAIVLVSGCIPGEVVEAEVEKVQRGTGWARTVRVVDPSEDRVPGDHDLACGGNVLAHVAYRRQLELKAAIIADAFSRIGRMALPSAIDVHASPVAGYRMRARLHVVRDRIGFYREGTHELCDAATTQQLLPESIDILRMLEEALRRGLASRVKEVELAENTSASERALHLTLRDETDPSPFAKLPVIDGVRGISCGRSLGGRPLVLWGSPDVTDTIEIPALEQNVTIALTRQAHAFFQGNRFLLRPLVRAVVEQVPAGRILDLYAGVGLFSVALAASGGHDVVAIEGDRVSAEDLKGNATRLGAHIEARHQSVESYLRSSVGRPIEAILVDPPRTGMTKEALQGALALRPSRLIYVSCDVATLARDARIIVDHGFRLTSVRGFDLFPNTAHVESLVVFDN